MKIKKVQVPPRVLNKGAHNQTFKSGNCGHFLLATLPATPKSHKTLVESSDTKNHPYTPAHLVIPAPESKDQRWFLKFWVWDAQQGKKVKKTDYSCNTIADLVERRKKATQDIKEINRLLRAGYIIDVKKSELKASIYKIEPTIEEAIKKTLEVKKSLKHFRDYNQKLSKFLEWLSLKGYAQISINKFSSVYVRHFIDALKEEKLSVRTINNYINVIGLVFSTAKKYHEGIAISNPIDHLQKQKNPKGKNIAFTQDEQEQLLSYMEEHHKGMLLFCITMFYTLARTDELSKLQFNMIGRFDKNKIYMPASIVKNGHNSGIDKHIVIPPQLAEWFDRYNLDKYPKDWFVFGKRFEPSPEPYPSKYLGEKFRTHVLNKFDFGKEYTLYSWKATGTSMYLLNGATTGSLMLQGGWEDPASFKAYLKSLGLLDNKEIFNTAPNLKINKKP
jgi:hypothetical protein